MTRDRTNETRIRTILIASLYRRDLLMTTHRASHSRRGCGCGMVVAGRPKYTHFKQLRPFFSSSSRCRVFSKTQREIRFPPKICLRAIMPFLLRRRCRCAALECSATQKKAKRVFFNVFIHIQIFSQCFENILAATSATTVVRRSVVIVLLPVLLCVNIIVEQNCKFSVRTWHVPTDCVLCTLLRPLAARDLHFGAQNYILHKYFLYTEKCWFLPFILFYFSDFQLVPPPSPPPLLLMMYGMLMLSLLCALWVASAAAASVFSIRDYFRVYCFLFSFSSSLKRHRGERSRQVSSGSEQPSIHTVQYYWMQSRKFIQTSSGWRRRRNVE